LHGSVILYYPDGFKMRELYFQMGKRDGLEILWNIGGIKEFEGNYVQDKPVGKFRIWYPTGTLSREFTYNHDGHMTDAKGWSVDGTPLQPGDLLQKDYFGKISEQTHALTQSLEGVFKEIETMTSLVTHDKSLNALHGTFPDFSEDLLEIQSELENLKSINAEMEEGGGIVSRETSETIWKTPATRKLIGRQIQNATEHIAQEIRELENVMKMVAESLTKKDLQQKNREPDSKENS